jgi:ribosome-binding factor A
MARDFERTRRVGEQIQRELADLIRREVKDPRLGMVTVSAVEVSKDFSRARIFTTVLGKDMEAAQEDLAILNHAAGFLRSQLGKRMLLRTVPQLQFVYDKSIETGSHLSALIDAAVASDHNSDE